MVVFLFPGEYLDKYTKTLFKGVRIDYRNLENFSFDKFPSILFCLNNQIARFKSCPFIQKVFLQTLNPSFTDIDGIDERN